MVKLILATSFIFFISYAFGQNNSSGSENESNPKKGQHPATQTPRNPEVDSLYLNPSRLQDRHRLQNSFKPHLSEEKVFGDGGNSYNLTGRGMTGEPKFSGKPKKNGRVVVKIDVNRSGKVINATVDRIKSNTTEQSLWDLALKMAKTATFNTDQAAAVKQRGTITFTFKVN